MKTTASFILLRVILRAIAIVSIALYVLPAHGQLKRGQRLLEEGRYSDAVRVLNREFNPKKPDAESGVMLAQAYYQLHEYEEAKDVLDRVGEAALTEADDMRFFADVLIANDDFSAAQIALFRLLARGNNDPSTWIWISKTNDLLAWDTVNTGSRVRDIVGANTVYNEYGPYAAENGDLWFINDGISVQSLFPVVYSDQNVHLFYKTRFKNDETGKIEKPSILLKKRDYYYHDGPLDQWPGQNKYAISLRVLDVDVNSARMGIFFSPFEGEDDMVPFKYNENYDTGHPTFNEDGSRMYFTSGRPGGFGQMDIWYCDWVDGNWTEPRNIGPFINTPNNEVFPLFKEGRFYFSSDRRDMGYGGLDLYMAEERTNYDKLYNLRAPINSAYDDFSISMIDEHEGYFSSDRPGGNGGDDIYRLTLYVEQVYQDVTLAMIIEDEIPPGTNIRITDKSGKIVQETKINSSNKIEMEGLKTRETYLLEVLDQPVHDKAKLALLNDQEEIVNTFKQKFYAAFEFVLLDPEDYAMDKVNNKDNTVLKYNLNGKVVTTDPFDFSNSTVNVKSSNGTTVGTSTITPEGDFEVVSLTKDESYRLETVGITVPHEVDIKGNSGAVVQSIKPIGQNSFSYTRTAPTASWMNTTEVVVPQVFAIQLGEELGTDERITLFDGDGNELYDCEADEDGFVALGNLTAGKAYRLNFENRELVKTDRLVILDGNGDTSQTVRPTDAHNYVFEYMMYDGFGKEELGQGPAMPSQNFPEKDLFKGKISDYGLPAGSMLLLTTLDGTVVDSIYPAENGSFTMRKIDKTEVYRLTSAADKSFNTSSTLKVYARDNSELASMPTESINSFKFGPLQPADLSQTLVKNKDVLKFTLYGVLTKPVGIQGIEKLTLLDADGNFLSEGYTTMENDFAFTGLAPANKFIIQSEIQDAYASITATRSINTDTAHSPIQGDGSFIIDFRKKKPGATTGDSESESVLAAGSTFDLPSVFYDFNSYRLLPASKASLDLLVELLNDLPAVRIEIQSHTDSRGPKSYNLTLSQKRAESVVNYLVSKGIDLSRLQSKGFGEDKLSNKCSDGVRCTEAEHALNRRTTFVIL